MATNFTIRFLRRKNELRIKLKGDFDGSSALLLFEALKRNSDDEKRIFIDTNGMRDIHPFGQAVFQSHLSELGQAPAEILFTGKKRALLVPENAP